MATRLEQPQANLDKPPMSHVCSQCLPEKHYSSSDALRRHRKTHHGGIKPSWQCPKCNQKPFPRKDRLTRHIKEKHTGEHLGECELCFKTFSNRYLKQHRKTCKSRSFGQATEPHPQKAGIVELHWNHSDSFSHPKQAGNENSAIALEETPRLKFVRGCVAPIFRKKKVTSPDKHEVVTASSLSTRKQGAVGNDLEPLKLDEEQQEEISYAIEADDMELLTEIIASHGRSPHTLLSVNEAYSCFGSSLLHFTARCGSMKVARMLLSAGIDVNAPDKDLWTPLHHAAYFSRAGIVRLLVRQGADVDAKDSSGRTALFQACSYEEKHADEADTLEMINILLQGDGASVDVEDRQKATALCVAASEGAHSVVKRLLTGGASVNGSPKEGVVTPLMKACHRGESTVVHLLIDHGADVNRCHARREFPDVWDPYNFLFLRGWKPDVGSGQIQSRWTALAYACGPYVLSRIMEELSSRLLAAGADPNLGDVVPLETAIIYGDQGVTKILLDAGADPLWVSNECIETLQGVQKRTDGHLYRKRKEKWSLLQQYYPIMFGSKEYLE